MTRHGVIGVSLGGVGGHASAWRWPGAVDGLLDAGATDAALARRRARRPGLRAPRRQLRPRPRAAPRFPRLDALLALARVAPAHHGDRAGADRHDHPHRAVPRLEERRHARPRLGGPGRLAGGGVHHAPRRPSRSAARTRPTARRRCTPRPRTPIEVASRLWDSWEDDAVIRDRRHRPLHRPRQAPLHRLRGRASSASAAPRSRPARRRASRSSWSTPTVPARPRLAARRADIVLIDAADLATASVAPARRSGAWSRRPAATRTTSAVLVTVRIGEPGLRRQPRPPRRADRSG